MCGRMERLITSSLQSSCEVEGGGGDNWVG